MEKPVKSILSEQPHLTAHSEFLPLHSVFLQPPKLLLGSQAEIGRQWEDLHYLSEPQRKLVLDQYTAFEALLKETGAELLHLPGGTDLSMDAVYCRDASIVTDFGVILCRMGKKARSSEPTHHLNLYNAAGIPVLGAIEAPGTLEGGDLAWLDRTTLAVGHSYRSNAAGIEQLRALLEPRGIEVLVVDLPHYKGATDVFHLMSILSPVDRDLVVTYSPLLPIGFRNTLLERGFSLVDVPDGEFDTLGCNVLATAPRECIMARGNPRTAQALRQAGCKLRLYPGSDISLKGGGGPTCLTRPYSRKISATS